MASPVEHPYGCGVNFPIEVVEAALLYDRVCAADCTVVIPLEERWYHLDEQSEGVNRQFVVADPDGYLLRLTSDLGRRLMGLVP